jgi:hypothetical protein
MTRIESIKELLRLAEENPKVPIRIKAMDDDCMCEDYPWWLLEFTRIPELVDLYEWNERLYDDEEDVIEQIENDYCGDFEPDTIGFQYEIYREVKRCRKQVILLNTQGSGL